MPELAVTFPAAAAVDVVGWLWVAVIGFLVATEVVGWTGHRWVAALQALAPFALGLAVPVGAVAWGTQRWALAGTAGAAGVALAVLSWPLVRVPTQPPPSPQATPVRIFHANLLYENTRTAEMAAAVADVEADVLAFAEYTPEHAAALHDRLPDEYPHRVEYAGTGATGSALWSRYPLTELPARPARAREILAIVGAPEPLAVYLVHPTSPLVSIVQWRQELAHLHDPPLPSGPPVAVVGDLNAAYWHPAFRAVLRRGWRDAHHVMRRGFSASWRNDVRPLPNFVRLDHALVRETLVVAAVDDVHVPGSDHVGFVVTVSPASRG